MGAMLIGTGLLFLTGSMNVIGQWMLETFPALASLEEWLTPKSLQVDIMKKGLGASMSEAGRGMACRTRRHRCRSR